MVLYSSKLFEKGVNNSSLWNNHRVKKPEIELKNSTCSRVHHLVTHRSASGVSLLHTAAFIGDISCVKFCLQNGMNINEPDNFNCTPYFW